MKFFAIAIGLTLLNIASAFIIKCNYTTHPQYGYGCNATSIKCPSEFKVCEVNAHESGKGNKDVLYFMASNDELQSFPEGLKGHFPKLETINLKFPRLNHICNEDLNPFGEKLKNLLIVESEIEFVPENLFKDTPNIRFLSFNSRSIKSIHKNAFDPLSSLTSMFVDVTCGGRELKDDARNRVEVEEQIKNLDIQCYNKNVPVPSPCKRKTIDGAGSECSGCNGKSTTLNPNDDSTQSTNEIFHDSTSEQSTTDDPIGSTTKKSDYDNSDWYFWVIGAFVLFVLIGGICFGIVKCYNLRNF